MKKKTISTAEARKHFAKITNDTLLGGVYVVVRHGKEVARIMPPESELDVRISPKLKKELTSLFERYNGALKELAQR